MSTIKNKECELVVKLPNGASVPIKKKYSDLIIDSLNNPPQTGFNVKEMKDRMRIVDIAEKANGEITIEHPADIEKLKQCVDAMPWAVLSKDLIVFLDEIEKL